jgi:DNA-binding transcriptional ArsR family regulator
MKRKELPYEALTLIAARFRVLSEPARLMLLQSLMDGPLSVQELCEQTGLGQANVSKHMAMLANNGIVAKEKQGLFSVYSIADESVFDICNVVCGSLEKQANAFQKVMRRRKGD